MAFGVFDGSGFPRAFAAVARAGNVAAQPPNEDVRYLAPMVPLVALLFAWTLVMLRRRWLTPGAAVLLAANWTAVHAAAHGFVTLPGDTMGYLQAPLLNAAAMERMTRAVRESCYPSRAGWLAVIGAELPEFNLPTADFYAEKMRRMVGYRCAYTWLGYLEGNARRAIKKLYDSAADIFVTLPVEEIPAAGADRLDRVSRPVADWIATSPDFERITSEGDTLVIYRRKR
jgi:hypothetical protein